MAWLWRGFQSAVFYYLSCAPCTKIAYQRRRHKATQQAKAERAMTEMEQGLYQHPSPFSTNIYWREEMALGPGPPQRKSNKDRERGRAESSRGLRSGGAGSSSVAGTSSADTVVDMELSEAGGGKQVGRRYQREDENLWGTSSDSVNSIGHSSTTGSRTGYCYVARNPAVNDLHPPVVSTQPTHPSQTRWMLQPPPSAKIMEGKIPSARRRSGSGLSHTSDSSSRKRDDRSLGRKVGERLLEGKVKRGEGLDMLGSRSVSASTSMRRLPSRESARSEAQQQQQPPSGQPHDRDDSSPDNALPLISLSPDSPDDHHPRRTSYYLRPPLSTITSTPNTPSNSDRPPSSYSPPTKALQPSPVHLGPSSDLDLSIHVQPDPAIFNSNHPDPSSFSDNSDHPSNHHRPVARDITNLPMGNRQEPPTSNPSLHDQRRPNTRGEMDWHFSLDARQKQLAMEQQQQDQDRDSNRKNIQEIENEQQRIITR